LSVKVWKVTRGGFVVANPGVSFKFAAGTRPALPIRCREPLRLRKVIEALRAAPPSK